LAVVAAINHNKCLVFKSESFQILTLEGENRPMKMLQGYQQILQVMAWLCIQMLGSARAQPLQIVQTAVQQRKQAQPDCQ
jgi:hypothetical protein